MLLLALGAIVALIAYFESHKLARPTIAQPQQNTPVGIPLPVSSRTPGTPARYITAKERKFDRAKEIANPDGFVNTSLTSSGQASALKISNLIGKKVILVDFWTYSCINCQRTQPYLNAWYQKYKDEGLEIIGVHTPEFEFEKKYENVKQAVKDEGIRYPVVLDNNYATWNAYENRYWPHRYLIDIDGFIVYDHIGEGAYDETEQKIRDALNERMRVLRIQGEVKQDGSAPANITVVDSSRLDSPETYFGAFRNEFLGNGRAGKTGVQNFTEPQQPLPNTLYLSGSWNIENQFAENTGAGDAITFRYRAKNIYFVASSPDSTRIKVLRDGKPLGQEAGNDILKDGSSSARIKDPKLYKLIQDPVGYGEHVLKIIIEKPGLRAFTFTFG